MSGLLLQIGRVSRVLVTSLLCLLPACLPQLADSDAPQPGADAALDAQLRDVLVPTDATGDTTDRPDAQTPGDGGDAGDVGLDAGPPRTRIEVPAMTDLPIARESVQLAIPVRVAPALRDAWGEGFQVLQGGANVPYERENWTGDAPILWVRINYMLATGTTLHVEHGTADAGFADEPEEVFAEYDHVFHMDSSAEAGGTADVLQAADDMVINAPGGTSTGGFVEQGVFGRGFDTGGTKDLRTQLVENRPTKFRLEVWVDVRETAMRRFFAEVGKCPNPGQIEQNSGFRLWLNDNREPAVLPYGTNCDEAAEENGTIPVGLHLLIAFVDYLPSGQGGGVSEIWLFRDGEGVSRSSMEPESPQAGAGITIASNEDASSVLDGTFDEVRISTGDQDAESVGLLARLMWDLYRPGAVVVTPPEE